MLGIWAVGACAQTLPPTAGQGVGADTGRDNRAVPDFPPVLSPPAGSGRPAAVSAAAPVDAAVASPAASVAASVAASPGVSPEAAEQSTADDPLSGLLGKADTPADTPPADTRPADTPADAGNEASGPMPEAPVAENLPEPVADTPEQAMLAELETGLAGPPEPLPPAPAPIVLFPHRLGEFPAAEREAPVNDGERATAMTDDVPPVFASSLPSEDPAEDSVWRLTYSGRAAYVDSLHTVRACPRGSSLSTGVGPGVACSSSGEVKVRESLLDIGGGGAIEVVAQARSTGATSVNGRPAAVDPYQLVPQFYTAVSGLAALDGATMWAGRRDASPFLLSSGLLPPTTNALRFGIDNARLGGVGLSYQFTSRDDTNGQHLPSYHSVRTGPISVNEQGTVQFGFTRVEANALAEAAGDAWWASVMHEQKGVLAGTNRFGVQYGTGSRVAMTGYTGMGDALSRVRLAESMEWKGRGGLIGSVESAVQFDRSMLGTLQWMTARVRPAYVANDQFRLSFEVAHDEISSGFGVSGQRTAVTVAPTLTLGKAAGNANLRAFYTYSRANDVDGITFAAPANAWASQASGSIFGIQLNRRW
ncbi:carbohydrate porin [Paracidovorax citrulli]